MSFLNLFKFSMTPLSRSSVSCARVPPKEFKLPIITSFQGFHEVFIPRLLRAQLGLVISIVADEGRDCFPVLLPFFGQLFHGGSRCFRYGLLKSALSHDLNTAGNTGYSVINQGWQLVSRLTCQLKYFHSSICRCSTEQDIQIIE